MISSIKSCCFALRSVRQYKYMRSAVLAFLFVLLINIIPARAAVGFVDYSGGKEVVPLAPYLEYLVDGSGRLDIERIFTQENQDRFLPFSSGLPLSLKGTLWLRFTLPPAPPGLEPPFLRLDLGGDTPAGAVLYMPDGNLNATLTTWIPQAPLEKNVFLLQLLGLAHQAQSPVTIYVKIPGSVGLWFAPQLLTTQPVSLEAMSGASILDMLAVFWSWLLSPSSSLVYVVLGLCTAWCLARAFRRGGEWRLWTAVFSVLALLQGMVPMPYAPAGKIPLQALLNVVIPGLCFILLVHVGRHLLHSKARKSKVDPFLVALSLLGVILPVVPLAPGMSGWLRVMPLWPVLAILPGLICLGAVFAKAPGAKRDVLSCLILALSGVLAWQAAGGAEPSPFLVQAPLWAVAIFVFLVGITGVREQRQDAAEEDGDMEGVEVLRLNDLVSGETLDDLLPPAPYEDDEAREIVPEPPYAFAPGTQGLSLAGEVSESAPETPEFDLVVENGRGLLPMNNADKAEGPKTFLKPVPKLAAASVFIRKPEPKPACSATNGLTAAGEAPKFVAEDDEPLIELRDIVTDREAELETTAAAEKTTPVSALKLEPEAFAAREEPLEPEMAAAPERSVASEAPAAPEAPTEITADFLPRPSSVSQPRPRSAVEPQEPVEPGEQTSDAALPWRRPLGGAKKGIDLVGDLIRHGDPEGVTDLAVKTPLLVGPDLLKGQMNAARLSGLVGETAHADEAQSGSAKMIMDDVVASTEEDFAAEPLPAQSEPMEVSKPVRTGRSGVDFDGLVDETAHADALWMGEIAAAQEEQDPVPQDDNLEFTEVDAWRLSDMARHGRASQEPGDVTPQPATAAAPEKETALPGQRLAAAEEELRTSLAALQAVLDSPERSEQDLYRAVREQSRTILNAGQRIMAQTHNVLQADHFAEADADEMLDLGDDGALEVKEEIFDLQVVLSEAHEAVRSEAERKNLALSWFMPPHLPLLYLGDPEQVREVLRQLLESAVSATEKGTVQLAVRRVPDSTDPGHLIFSVADSSSGPGAARRSPWALKRAWSLAAAHGGGLNVESAPGQGSTVAFTMRLKRPPDDLYSAMPGLENDPAMLGLHSGGTEHISIISRQENGILIVDEQATNRQLIAFFLGNLPYHVVEARTLDEALSIYAQKPVGLVILDASLEGLNMNEALKKLHDVDSSLKLSPVSVAALIQDHEEIAAMLSAGCKGTLRKPLSRKRVRDLIQTLLPGQEIAETKYADESDFEPAPGAGPVATPLKGSPEDYVSHLEFDLAAEPAESGEATDAAPADSGFVTDAAASSPQERSSESGESKGSAVKNSKNAMDGLSFLQFGTPVSRREVEPEITSETSPSEEIGEEKFVFGDLEPENGKEKASRPARGGADESGRTEKVSAASPETGIGRSRWLSGILDAAGKVAGAVAQQVQASGKPEEEQPGFIPLDAQSLKVAGPEQLALVPQVLEDLDAALWAAKEGLAEGNCLAVSQACLRLADIAGNHHLENLDRIARCVERAAQANDLEAVHDLLSELEASVGRNRKQILMVLDDRGHFND